MIVPGTLPSDDKSGGVLSGLSQTVWKPPRGDFSPHTVFRATDWLQIVYKRVPPASVTIRVFYEVVKESISPWIRETQMEEPGFMECMRSARVSINPSIWPDERVGKQGIPGDGEDH